MKVKTKITEDNYKEVVFKRAIIICWVLLAICFVIKLFGGNYFAIACSNEKFIKVCEYIDSSALFYVIQFIVSIFSMMIVMSSIDPMASKAIIAIKSALCLVLWSIKHLQSIGVLHINLYLIDIIDFVFIYFVSMLLFKKGTNKRTRYLKPLLFVVLIFIFTLISSVVKNIGLSGILPNYSLIGLIYMIDYYIMTVMLYLYEKRRV